MEFKVYWKSQSPEEAMVFDCSNKDQAKELFFAKHDKKIDTVVIESGGEVSFHAPISTSKVNEQERESKPKSMRVVCNKCGPRYYSGECLRCHKVKKLMTYGLWVGVIIYLIQIRVFEGVLKGHFLNDAYIVLGIFLFWGLVIHKLISWVFNKLHNGKEKKALNQKIQERKSQKIR